MVNLEIHWYALADPDTKISHSVAGWSIYNKHKWHFNELHDTQANSLQCENVSWNAYKLHHEASAPDCHECAQFGWGCGLIM